VPLDEEHLFELIADAARAPPLHNESDISAVRMGFPVRVTASAPTPCIWYL
jgi:hypothetical protein